VGKITETLIKIFLHICAIKKINVTKLKNILDENN